MMKTGRTSQLTETRMLLIVICAISVLSAPVAIPALYNLFFQATLGKLTIEIQTYYTSFIALCTTFVVGFQIFNAMEWKGKIESLEDSKRELENKIKEIDVTYAMSMYFNAYTIGKQRFSNSQLPYNHDSPIITPRYCWNSFRAFSNALLYAANEGHSVDHALEGFEKNMLQSLAAISAAHVKYRTQHEGDPDFRNPDDADFPSYKSRVSILHEVVEALDKAESILRDKDKTREAQEIAYIREEWVAMSRQFYPEKLKY